MRTTASLFLCASTVLSLSCGDFPFVNKNYTLESISTGAFAYSRPIPRDARERVVVGGSEAIAKLNLSPDELGQVFDREMRFSGADRQFQTERIADHVQRTCATRYIGDTATTDALDPRIAAALLDSGYAFFLLVKNFRWVSLESSEEALFTRNSSAVVGAANALWPWELWGTKAHVSARCVLFDLRNGQVIHYFDVDEADGLEGLTDSILDALDVPPNLDARRYMPTPMPIFGIGVNGRPSR